MNGRRLALTAIVLLMWRVPPVGAVPAETGLAERNTAFALELHRRLRAEAGNVFFSPIGLSEALAMAWSGARGDTAAQMAKVLHLPAPADAVHREFREIHRRIEAVQKEGKSELALANSLWPQADERLLPEYLSLVKEFYGAAPTPVDYLRSPDAARSRINGWIEKKTRERIKDLLPPGSVGSDTRLVLANAVYFKGRWSTRFDKALTQAAAFHTAPGKTVSTPLMRGSPNAGYLEANDAQILRLPYQSDGISLVVLLPKNVDGLRELEDRLTAAELTKRLSSLSASRRQVDVWLPRFRVNYGFRLRTLLASLGMTDAFDAGRANFQGMSGAKPGLFISEGFHKSFVDVNEEGTEAAAATGLVMIPASAAPPRPVFRADHPFLFLIRDDVTGTLLFLGSVTDPTR